MCGNYQPDVQAQCDCINCGQPWEKHQNEKRRQPMMKLTATVKDRFGGLVPQIIMIDGATPVHQIGQEIVEAVRVQTVNDGTGIVKATIGQNEIYNAE